MDNFTLILILIAVVVILVLIYKAFKIPKFGSSIMITGAPKSGKSTTALWLARRRYFSCLINYYLHYFLSLILRLKKPEKPLLYSNVKLAGINYVLLTEDLLLRTKRFRYGSVVYIQEASLVADSSLGMIRNNPTVDLISEQLLLFNKLIGHEMRSGKSCVIWDTQSIADVHHSIKKCLNGYIKCHHIVKLPFFILCYCREYDYSYDVGTELNVQTEDVEKTLIPILIPKRVWKNFDAYCYSALTDDLPVVDKVDFTPIPPWYIYLWKKPYLKMKEFLSFRKFRSIKKKEKEEITVEYEKI